MAGLRIGWLATKDKQLMQKFCAVKDYITICSSAPSEVLALMGLRAKDVLINRSLTIIKDNLVILDNFFNTYQHLFSWHRPNAGPIGFARLLHNQLITEFARDVVDKQGVMILPSSVYDYGESHFRIGFGRKDMPEVLSKFEDYIKKYL